MYLYVGKKIFDCQKGILITSGLVHENAKNIAKTLGIEIKEKFGSLPKFLMTKLM